MFGFLFRKSKNKDNDKESNKTGRRLSRELTPTNTHTNDKDNNAHTSNPNISLGAFDPKSINPPTTSLSTSASTSVTPNSERGQGGFCKESGNLINASLLSSSNGSLSIKTTTTTTPGEALKIIENDTNNAITSLPKISETEAEGDDSIGFIDEVVVLDEIKEVKHEEEAKEKNKDVSQKALPKCADSKDLSSNDGADCDFCSETKWACKFVYCFLFIRFEDSIYFMAN